MNQRDALDRMLSAWAEDAWAPPAPAYLGKVLDRTRRTRQRPAWASLERWLPMSIALRPPLSAPLRLLAIVLALLLLLLAAVAVPMLVGSPSLPATVLIGPHNGLIAFESSDGDIYVAEADGTRVRPFVTGPATQFGPVWSPDGSRLAYFEEAEGSTPAVPLATVRVVDVDGTGERVLGGGRKVTSPLVGSSPYVFTIYGLAWSPDSRTVGYTHLEPGQFALTPQIEMVDLDGSDPVVLPVDVEAWDPSWSPDGEWLAFKARRAPDASSQGVWIARTNGTGLRRVTVTPHADYDGRGFAFSAPRWSPDGRMLLYYCCEGGNHDIWLAAVDGSNERRLTTDAADEFWPSWSPDGSRIAYGLDPLDAGSDGDCCIRIWLATADGAERVRLNGQYYGVTGPLVWSPDGTAIVTLPESWMGFVVVDVATGETRATIADPAGSSASANRQVSWQPLTS
jgi:TolB protein